MEILYIYLQNYKNIQKQAIPLAGEFTFITTVDQDQVILKIEENPAYIAGFFENPQISVVTAIIGQNGSGKSNILEFIRTSMPFGMDDIWTDCIIATRSPSGYNKELEYHLYSTGGITLMLQDLTGKFSSPRVLRSRETAAGQIGYEFPNSPNTTFLYYSNIVDLKLPGRVNEVRLESENEKPSMGSFFNISTMAFLSQDQLEFVEAGGVDYDRTDCYRAKEHSRNFEFVATNRDKLPFPLPDYMIMEVLGEEEKFFQKDTSYAWLFDPIDRFSSEFRSGHNSPEMVFYNKLLRAAYFHLQLSFHRSGQSFSDREILNTIEATSFQAYFMRLLELIEQGKAGISVSIGADTKAAAMKGFVDFIFEYLIANARLFIEEQTGALAFPVNAEGQKIFERFFELYLAAKVQADFLNVRWRSLSSGEQSLLTLMSRFSYAAQNLPEDTRSLIILCDEPDVYFHPEWQRRLFRDLLTIVTSLFPGYRIQLLLTANTPYLVSDLPPSSVVMIGKEKGQKMIYRADEKDKQTFASNIHTLLSEDFYVSSLMGEFAKQKLEALIAYLKGTAIGETFTPDGARALIDIVGEPMIRDRLTDLYNTRFQIGEESLEQKLARLQQEVSDVREEMSKRNRNDQNNGY